MNSRTESHDEGNIKKISETDTNEKDKKVSYFNLYFRESKGGKIFVLLYMTLIPIIGFFYFPFPLKWSFLNKITFLIVGTPISLMLTMYQHYAIQFTMGYVNRMW